MALAPASTSLASHDDTPADLRWFVFALFFIFGGITSLNDVLIPKLKSLFTLDYAEVMLVQSAFFAAYFLVSLPAAAIVRRIGYMRTAALGLVTMTAGCLMFIPASVSAVFPAFLAALFVLASGVTIVQVVANPLISMLGRAEAVHSRLTFAQAFNARGTTVFPFFGARLILGSLPDIDRAAGHRGALATLRAQETGVIVTTYLGIAAALVIVAVAVWLRRDRLAETPVPRISMFAAFDLLKRPRFALGALAIFVYVGAEVSIGSLLANFLMQADTLAVAAQSAGELIAFYWGGAMIGRFIGAGLLRRFEPALVLCAFAVGAGLLLLTSANTVGLVAGWSLIAIGLMNSIMFPTIFSLASEGLGTRAAEGSGIICMAIVGGAIEPLVTGVAADGLGLRAALFVPLAGYVYIAGVALATRRLTPQ
ncbi:MFS transporter [Polymorphobacter multimanifer]|uniref:sugar MFS transporter n=1 Tax=Polymorphobacter multimanifer TaxID=1070431 RepID=UPI0016685864|nr:sugar MFS transporter [Polymorphobacter multimanifer]GGI86459.1 MFS transporter [Polymorphobacter multimanifer]